MGFYADFVTGLAALNVTGVTKKVESPPVQVNTAQLPMMFVRLPTGANQTALMTGSAGLKTATCELVILVEAQQQNTTPRNFALVLTLLDAMETALQAAAAADAVIENWNIRQDMEVTSETTFYWALVASVTGSA